MFEKAFHYFQFNQEEYMAAYHKRSKRGIDLLGHQAEVWRFGGEQDRRGDGKRSPLQNPLPQPDVSDSGTGNLGIVPVSLKDETDVEQAVLPMTSRIPAT